MDEENAISDGPYAVLANEIQGISLIKKKRAAASLSIVLFFIINTIVDNMVAPEFRGILFVSSILIMILLVLVFLFSVCPRCNKLFFLFLIVRMKPFSNSCVNCGLLLKAKDRGPKT